MDSGLKKRLLGAAVLIALAVIFVPLLLPGRSGRRSRAVDLKIPPAPAGAMQTRILQVGPGRASAGSGTAVAIADPDHIATLNLDSAAVRARAAADARPISGASAAVVAPSTPAPGSGSAKTAAREAPAVVAKSTSAPEPAVAAVQEDRPVAGGPGAAAATTYTLNLGIYANHGSAKKLAANAKRHGFTASTTQETFEGKSVLRVRVGPFANRAAAEAARLKVQGFEPIKVVIDTSAADQSGDAPASAISAGEPGAWAVQLAAYSSRGAADKLRDRLRGRGFDGYIDSVNTAKGELWRVRAGPFASRAMAAATRGQIAHKLKIRGDIVTQQ